MIAICNVYIIYYSNFFYDFYLNFVLIQYFQGNYQALKIKVKMKKKTIFILIKKFFIHTTGIQIKFHCEL